MKKSLLFALMLAGFAANSQQKLIGSNVVNYDETGAVQYIDSNEFIYNSWDGSLFSNEPAFTFEGAVFDWSFDLPAIKWNAMNTYFGISLPLTLNGTWNNTLVNGNATVSESVSQREEFIYDAAGNIVNEKFYYFNGLVFELNYEIVSEFDSNDNKLVEEYIYHGSGSPILESIDSSFYNAGNNLIRNIRYQWDGASAFYAISESLITYSGSEVSNIRFYEGNQSDPLMWTFDIDYSYSGGKPSAILGYQVFNGVPEMTVYVTITYSYGANNKISNYQGFIQADLFQNIDYSYDANGFISELITSQLDANTSMMYVSEASTYYYQSTADVDEKEFAEATIFPNPSSDLISISTDSKIEHVAIFGMNGKIMLTQTSGDIDISNLPNGVYIAKVKTSTGVSQARFVKQ